VQYEYVFQPKVFAELQNAQAIVLPYDGLNPHPPTYCFLKPHYLAGLHQLVDLPSRHAVHIRPLHHGERRVLGPLPRSEERRKIQAWSHLRNRQLDRAHARIPRPPASFDQALDQIYGV